MRAALLPCLLIALGAACGTTKGATTDPQSTVLKNWTVSRCLANAFKGSPAGEDASVTAAAYLEQGDAPAEAYEQLEKLASDAATEPRSGSVPGQYNTMKCIDLYASPDLNAAVSKVPAH